MKSNKPQSMVLTGVHVDLVHGVQYSKNKKSVRNVVEVELRVGVKNESWKTNSHFVIFLTTEIIKDRKICKEWSLLKLRDMLSVGACSPKNELIPCANTMEILKGVNEKLNKYLDAFTLVDFRKGKWMPPSKDQLKLIAKWKELNRKRKEGINNEHTT
jgi:hypothetical protein